MICYPKLNLGCGSDIREGYVNQDVVKREGVSDCFDLNIRRWLYPNNYFCEVVMQDVIEHLNDPVAVLKEVRRILRSGGVCKIRTGHYLSRCSYIDISHRHAFSIDSFDSVPGFHVVKKRINFGKGLNILNYLIEPVMNLFPVAYEASFLSVFPCETVSVELMRL